MKRKPIKIDWDDLEEAFSNPGHDVDAFLDRITGHIVLAGEGDAEDDFGTASQRTDPTQVRITPPETPLKIEWLKVFLAGREGDEHATINADLTGAMETENPAESISAILNANTDVRDAWYIYRSEQIQGLIDRWLVEHEILTVDVPPWRAA